MDTSVYPVLHVTPWDPGLAAKRDSSERLHKEGQNDADDHGASKSSRIGSLSSSALWIKFKDFVLELQRHLFGQLILDERVVTLSVIPTALREPFHGLTFHTCQPCCLAPRTT